MIFNMKKILTTIAIFLCISSFAQNAHMIFGKSIIRYNASIIPADYCINGYCSYLFKNGNGDTLAVAYADGVIDIRVNVSVKDTLNSFSIIDVTGTLSATRTMFNGNYAVAFNAGTYYTFNDRPPFHIRKVSDNSLYSVFGTNGFLWWLQPMPALTTITTNIKRFVLP